MADTSPTTVIGPDTTIKGEITVDQTAQILGTIEGQITSKGEIHLAGGSKCNASVDANKVIIEGHVTGDVSGRESVKLSRTARVKGDLIAAKLIVEEGAVFVGHCRVGGDAAKAAANKAAAVTEAKPTASRSIWRWRGAGARSMSPCRTMGASMSSMPWTSNGGLESRPAPHRSR